MRTTIDSGGRVVIPRDVRSQLGLQPGQVVDIAVVDGRVSIDVTGVGMHLEVRDNLAVAVPEEDVEPLTAETVRATLEQLRR